MQTGKKQPLLGLIISVLTIGYLIPTGVAAGRGKRNVLGIFVLNLLTGWTIVGWVMALIWACLED